MKKIIFILILICITGSLFAQFPVPSTGGGLPIKQFTGSDSTLLGNRGIGWSKYGTVNGVYADTTAANLTRIRQYPGAMIFTSLDTSMWLRSSDAKKWIRGSGSVDITSFTFDNDTTGIICFSNGVCDTFSIVNLFNVVTNIVQNFSDSSIFNINDSTLLICHGQGAARVCDTIHLGNSNTYYFLNDSTLVSCDTIVTTCVGDSCYQTQLCDTTVIPGQQTIPITFYQNGLRKVGNLVTMGDYHSDVGASQLLGDTWLWTNGYQYNIQGRALERPGFTVQQEQWSLVSSSIAQFNHLGNYIGFNPSAIDNNNPVNLYFNYIDPFTPGNGVFTGDTIGFMYDRIGYALMTNSQGERASYSINSTTSKQTGVMLHTFDTSNTDAVTIFGNQVPKNYGFSSSPFPTTTLLDSRIAVFKTTKQQQNPGYTSLSSFPGVPQGVIGFDSQGNFLTVSGAGTSTVRIITDTSIEVCNQSGCDTFTVNISNPSIVNIYNDTTLIICNEAGSCDTLTINNYTITNGSVVNIANTVFVAKSGNDGTGVRQRLDLPFLTIRAALTAAFPGDVIVVYPGTYVETGVLSLQNSVNFHFIGRGTLQLTTSLASSPIFTDSNTVATSVIDGEGWTFEGRSTQKVINLTAPSNVTFVANNIIAANGRAIDIYDSASINIRANYLYGNAFAGQIWVDSALSFTASIDLIQAGPFGNAIWTSNTNHVQVYAKRIIADPTNADYLIHIFDTKSTDSVYIEADELKAGEEWAVWAKGASPAIVIHAKTISATSDCVVTSSTDPGGMLTVQADIIEDFTTGAIDGIVHGEGGDITLIGAKIKRNVSATGPDISTVNFGGDDGHLYLNAVSYDTTKVSESPAGTITRIDRDFYSGISGKFAQATTAPYVMVYGATGRELQILPIDSISGGGGGVTGYNGLTSTLAKDSVALGGTLIQGTTIDGNGQAFLITSSDITQPTIRIESNGTNAHTSLFENFGFGSAIVATGHDNAAIQSISIHGNYALLTQSTSSTADFNGIVPGIQISGGGSNNLGTNGIGVSIDFRASTTTGYFQSNQIISKLTDAVTASRTSTLTFTGLLSASTVDLLTLAGDGSMTMRPITATAASAITPAEGMIVFVSNTNGTFLSVGFWGYQGGVWIKM